MTHGQRLEIILWIASGGICWISVASTKMLAQLIKINERTFNIVANIKDTVDRIERKVEK